MHFCHSSIPETRLTDGLYLLQVALCAIFLLCFLLIIKEENAQVVTTPPKNLMDVQTRDQQRISPLEWKGLLLLL